ncbi:Pkinase-domain-containing protein [Hesseltinella vesiculosa]|uniref:Pkinase-domain-containing protein n=1 Tax=Hesseltinella vesiculosa TaxID=101127 RepID=A0A1X2GXM6_9FUNG|nr:Pkinase-domain-containing protein [Hesseltinella vesiculosa]
MSKAPVTVPCKYKTGKILGTGTYATVKEAMHIDTGKFYACKVINKKLMEGREHMIRNEINIMRKVSQGHNNILCLVDYFETMNNLYLVMELAQGGELFDRICQKGNYFEQDAANVIRTICDAVAYLHDNGIVHRDLKPENLIFRTPDENSDLLIADFGLSRIVDSEKIDTLRTLCGTPSYISPEIFKKTGHGKPVDMWAIGVISYFLLCGYTPFERDSTTEEMQAIMHADYTFDEEYWYGVSDEAKDFIRQCLTIDTQKRITAREALEHPWLIKSSQQEPAEGQDLLPTVRKNFNARKTFKRAVDMVRLSYHLVHQKHPVKAAATPEGQKAMAEVQPVNEGVEEVLKNDDQH